MGSVEYAVAAMKHFGMPGLVLLGILGILITFSVSQNCNCKEEDLNYGNRLNKLSGDIQNLVREDMYFDSKGVIERGPIETDSVHEAHVFKPFSEGENYSIRRRSFGPWVDKKSFGGWVDKRSSERWPIHGYSSYKKRMSKRSLASLCASVMGYPAPEKKSLSGWVDKRHNSGWVDKRDGQWSEVF